MGRVVKHRDALSLVARADPKWRHAIIQQAPKEFVDCVSECCLNVLKGVVPVSPHQKTLLKRKKQQLRDLADRHVSVTKKKKIIQSGGFLHLLGPLLGKVAAPLIGGILGPVLGKLF